MWRSMTNQSELVTEAAINAAIKARWFYANKVLFTSGSISLDDSTRSQLTAAAPLIAAEANRLAAKTLRAKRESKQVGYVTREERDYLDGIEDAQETLELLADEWEGKANGS